MSDTLKAPLIPETKDCYVCGTENRAGFQIAFLPDGPKGTRAEYTARAEHCGWPGVVHGGVLFTLMDEALAYALFMHGLAGVTARVETRFRRAVSVGTRLIIRAWMVEQRRRLVDVRAEVRLADDETALVAEADATMYLQKLQGRNSEPDITPAG